MWFLVTVVKGNRHYETESPIGNRCLISDATEMVICGRAAGGDHYRFEARRGNETYIIGDFVGAQPAGELTARFLSMARQLGAVVVTEPA